MGIFLSSETEAEGVACHERVCHERSVAQMVEDHTEALWNREACEAGCRAAKGLCGPGGGEPDPGPDDPPTGCEDDPHNLAGFWSWAVTFVRFTDTRFDCDGTWTTYSRIYRPGDRDNGNNGVGEESTQQGTWSAGAPDADGHVPITVASGGDSATWTLLNVDADGDGYGDTIRFPDGSTMIRSDLRDPWYPGGCCDGPSEPRGPTPAGKNSPF